MKKIGCTLIILLLMQQVFAQASKFDHLFTLKGKLYGTHMDSVDLYYKNLQGAPVFQSQPIFNDRFIFSDSINNPIKVLIIFKNRDSLQSTDIEKNKKEIFLDHGLLTIQGDPAHLEAMKMTGSETQDEADSLAMLTSMVRAEMKPLVDICNLEKDPENAAIIRTKFEPYEDRVKAISYRFFLEHPNSYLTADQMVEFVDQMSLDSARTIYKNYNIELKQSDDGKKLDAEIKKMESVLPGNTAPAFASTDINGKTVALSDYKGKYVMLDFWASWSDACRADNRHMVELYDKYKDNGFNIISIASDDDTQKAWKLAVTKDHIGQWPNLLWGGDTNNDIGDKYAIHYVRTRILIDPSGKIIARYGDNVNKDKEMDKMLASIFGVKPIVAFLVSLS